jgi:hypothetical protein
MPWNTISETQLVSENVLAQQDYAAYANLVLHNGFDSVPNLIANAIAQIRAAIGSNLKVYNQLGANGTVPDEARDATMRIVVWRMIACMPNAPDKNSKVAEAKAASEKAFLFLEELRKGTVFIVGATTFSTSQLNLPSAVQVVRCGTPPCYFERAGGGLV